jgi:hypothetical protein
MKSKPDVAASLIATDSRFENVDMALSNHRAAVVPVRVLVTAAADASRRRVGRG